MDDRLRVEGRYLKPRRHAWNPPWPIRLAFATLTAFGCEATSMPGTSLGTYSVTGKLTANSCGTALEAPDPWTFKVDLSKDGSTLYWKWSDASTLSSGVLDDERQTTIETTVAGAADADGGVSSCSMQRQDVLDVKLAEGEPPSTFDGGLSFTFSALSGSDCTGQLTASGGNYQTLPCTLSYSFTATRE